MVSSRDPKAPGPPRASRRVPSGVIATLVLIAVIAVTTGILANRNGGHRDAGVLGNPGASGNPGTSVGASSSPAEAGAPNVAPATSEPPAPTSGAGTMGVDSTISGDRVAPAASPATARPAVRSSPSAPAAAPEIRQMFANTAVMVTVELELGTPLPTVAAALAQIERRHQPDDKSARTFAILDAYGEPTPDGRKLHLSMHLSAEKPGLGSLVNRRTGQVLWQAAILASPDVKSVARNLSIFVDDGAGKAVMVDGSRNPASILDAPLQDGTRQVRELWPDGSEREVTFIYSACGCPVKAMVRRSGERTVRTSDRPVMFPDDPAAMQVIQRMMGWSE